MRLSLALLCLALAGGARASSRSLEAARPLAPVAVETADGESLVLGAAAPDFRATVVLFGSRECEVSRYQIERLAVLREDYAAEQVRFLCVNSNPAEVEDPAAWSAGRDVTTLVDPLQSVAAALGVRENGVAVVLDAAQRVRYRGPLDDHFEGAAGREYVVEVLEALLMEEDVAPHERPAGGSPLESPYDADVTTPRYTFHADVAPLLYRECSECHRPGQIGPMALLAYEDAAAWAPMIAEVVGNGRMPPWSASPAHGRFENERRLSELEKFKIVRWAVQGAAAGDPAAQVAPPDFPDAAWEIGAPDLVIDIPRQEVPAEGTIPYRYILVDPGFEEDRWVTGIELKPGNRAVLHHIIAFLLPVGMSTQEFFRDPLAPLGDGMFAGYAPGSRAAQYSGGLAQRIPKKARFLFELHYTASGTATSDASRLGIQFARGEVTRRVRTKGIINYRLDIAPGDPAATFQAEHTFRAPVQLLSLSPHMHSRGKAMEFDLVAADGAARRLLSVPEYDFSWQHTYVLAEPLAVAAGDTMHVTAVFDNSPENPSNPDPTARVFWGDQTWNEMLIGFLTYVDAE